MLVAHKIALDLNSTQVTYCRKASGTARFAYNYALAEWQRQYKEGLKPSDISIRKQLNAIKREQFPWMYDISKTVVQEAIINLGTAFDRFFKKVGKYPQFKKRGGHDSFCAANYSETIKIDGKRIKLPLIGWLKMWEAVRFSGTAKRATISREADRWFVSLMIEADIKPATGLHGAVGIDLGVKTFATLSTGEAIEGPKSHKNALKRLRKANKTLARRQRGSKRYHKAKQRLARLHARIACVRKDATHKLTSKLAKTYAVIGIEDLNVSGMSKNRKLARSIMDGGFFEFRRQLEYKIKWYGSKLGVVSRWFPSSKTCNYCGVVKSTLELRERTFVCESCGHIEDRDLNAAKNIVRQVLVDLKDRGEISSGLRKILDETVSTKRLEICTN